MSTSALEPEPGTPGPQEWVKPKSRGFQRLRSLAWMALLALPSVGLLFGEWRVFGDFRGFPLDDSFIHLTFARSIAAGEGLAYDGLPPVAASTAPLWTALLALLEPLPGEPFLPAKLLGIALHLVGAFLAGRVARRLGAGRGGALATSVLLAWSGWLVWSSISGMEIPLAVALALWGYDSFLSERQDSSLPRRSVLLFSLASLARPELLVLLVARLAEEGMVFARGRDGALRWVPPDPSRFVATLAAAAGPLLAVGLVHLGISGTVLPTTYAAKVGSGMGGFDLERAGSLLRLLFVAEPIWVLVAGAGAVELLRRAGGPRDAGGLLLAWAVGIPAALVVLSGDGGLPVGNFGRYLFPVLPAWLLLAAVGLDRLTGSFRRLAVGRFLLPLGALGWLLLFSATAAGSLRASGLYLRARSDVERSVVAMAVWVANHLPPEARLATCDVGALAYWTPNPIVDLAGLLQPELSRRVAADPSARPGAWAHVVLAWIEEQRPDFIALYPRWLPLLEADPLSFPVRHRIPVPGNITMAGDELVLYSTPWNRYPP